MFSGSIPALVTPFDADGHVDTDAFRAFVDWQIDEGSSGLIPGGTTGESATLRADELRTIVSIASEQARGRVPVIAGCGGYDTATVAETVAMVAEAGADAALCVAPYYNRPNQDGLVAHFTYLAETSPIPIMVYNVPSRTVADILPETMGKIAKLEKVVAIKDASGDLSRVTAHRALCGEDFAQLSGNDDLSLGFSAMGGVGCVSVTANVAPRLCSQFQEAMLAKKWDEALVLQDKLFPLHKAMFADASPGPAKYALSKVRPGFATRIRLPMTEASDVARAAVDAALAHAGLVG